jgi:hypothetical protein
VYDAIDEAPDPELDEDMPDMTTDIDEDYEELEEQDGMLDL